jgi:CO/xanthine dehydrogenase Mo-binding subunit
MFLDYANSSPIYSVPNIEYDGKGIYSNKMIGNPKRGHGTPHARFAVDCQIGIIAEELGINTLEIMLKNPRKKGDVLPNGDTLHSYGLHECIEKVADAIEWKS